MTCSRAKPGPLVSQAGFSVLELLISLALLALIFAGAPAALRLGQRAWETSEDLDRIGTATAALSFIEQRLLQAMPLYERLDDGRLRIAFNGSADSISFIAPARIGENGGGLYRFELTGGAAADARRGLQLRWTLYRPFSQLAETSGRMLDQEVVDARFRYFGPIKVNEASDWVDQWTRTDVLPQLVEIRLITRNSALPPALVELRLRPVR